jgi:hypothetical protein
MQEAPKNLKVLQPDEVMPQMRTFTSGLGVRCDFCHVSGDMSADTNRMKVVARNMISMTRQVNQAAFNGRARVTCYTCHHGKNEPEGAPAAAGPGGPPPGL